MQMNASLSYSPPRGPSHRWCSWRYWSQLGMGLWLPSEVPPGHREKACGYMLLMCNDTGSMIWNSLDGENIICICVSTKTRWLPTFWCKYCFVGFDGMRFRLAFLEWLQSYLPGHCNLVCRAFMHLPSIYAMKVTVGPHTHQSDIHNSSSVGREQKGGVVESCKIHRTSIIMDLGWKLCITEMYFLISIPLTTCYVYIIT